MPLDAQLKTLREALGEAPDLDLDSAWADYHDSAEAPDAAGFLEYLRVVKRKRANQSAWVDFTQEHV